MIPIDADIGRASALVIDGVSASRAALAAMLRSFGVGRIVQVSRSSDARRLLEHEPFDLVVCEYHFDGQPMTGQDLIDDLRLAQVLPLSTVVVMISSEAGYSRVAEAAEAALDAYLLKPHTEAALRERVARARESKRALGDIIASVAAGRHAEAAALCDECVRARRPHWLQAARIGAELYLRLGRPQAAQTLFEAILQTRALPWARLGIARSAYQAGSVQQARRTLESLLNDQPSYADAYDVLSRVLLDSGQPAEALAALQRASSLAPGCISRLQKLGVLAFYHGDPHEAAETLRRAAALGLNSRVFDLQGLVLLAALQYDGAEARALQQSLAALRLAAEQQPASARLRRFESVVHAFRLLQQRRIAEALQKTQQLLAETRAPDFDFEAACNLLTLLSRLLNREVDLADWPLQLEALAGRFAVSRTTCDLLCRAAGAAPRFDAPLQRGYARIGELAGRAVESSINGAPRDAALLLLEGAEATLSSKLLDLAIHTLERHADRIADAAELMERAQALHRRYRSYGTQTPLPQAEARRCAGAAAMRGSSRS